MNFAAALKNSVFHFILISIFLSALLLVPTTTYAAYCYDSQIDTSSTSVAEPTCFETESACTTAQGNASGFVTRSCYSNTENSEGWIASALQWVVVGAVKAILFAIVSTVSSITSIVSTGFDYALHFTITDFSNTFKMFEGGVNTAWAGFRDVANIVMIAMFVFVAFAVILGSQTYGLKKFGVRIVVVALLINFSLFFTKAIIDISNITALQIGKAIQISNNTTGTTGNQEISTAIMHKLGISSTSYFGAYERLNAVAEKGEGWGALTNLLLYAVVVIVLSVALIFVFMYGIILLITRMVALLVLMMTSSLAFTSYMIPKYGDNWWNMWWDNLIKYCIFGPLLMLMLWAILNIISGLGAASSTTNSIDALVTKSSSAWEPIMHTFVVIGLVYASIQITEKLSIAGASFAKKFAGFGATTGIAGARFAGLTAPDFILNKTFGRGWRQLKSSIDNSVGRTAVQRGAGKAQDIAQRYNLGAQLDQTLNKLAGSRLSPSDTKLAKSLEKATGVGVTGFNPGSAEAERDYENTRKEKGYDQDFNDIRQKQLEEQQGAAKAVETIKNDGGTANTTAAGGGAPVQETPQVDTSTQQEAADAITSQPENSSAKASMGTGKDASIDRLAKEIREKLKSDIEREQQLGGKSDDAIKSEAERNALKQFSEVGDVAGLKNAIEQANEDEARRDRFGNKKAKMEATATRKKLESLEKTINKGSAKEYYGGKNPTAYQKGHRENLEGKLTKREKSIEDVESSLTKQIKALNKDE